jgi:hypothetical protein
MGGGIRNVLRTLLQAIVRLELPSITMGKAFGGAGMRERIGVLSSPRPFLKPMSPL